MANSLSSWEATPVSLAETLRKNWWLFLVRGLTAIAFGVVAVIWPGVTMISLVLLYGAYALVDGLCALAAGIMGRTSPLAPSWWLVLVGLLGVGVGLLFLAWPQSAALAFIYLTAAWAFVVGALQIVGGIQLRNEFSGEWLLILNGILSVLFGIVLFVMPAASAVALVWLIATFAIIYGVAMVSLAFRVRELVPS